MTKHIFILTLSAAILFPLWTLAQEPDVFPFSGVLEMGGVSLDGVVNFSYRIYDKETGGKRLQDVERIGSVQYGEVEDVVIRNGRFEFDIHLHPAVTVPAGGTTELWVDFVLTLPFGVHPVTLAKRHALVAVPYAFRCRNTDSLPPGISAHYILNVRDEPNPPPEGWLAIDNRFICVPGNRTCEQWSLGGGFPECTRCDARYRRLIEILGPPAAYPDTNDLAHLVSGPSSHGIIKY